MVRNLLLTGGIFHPFDTSTPALTAILDEQGISSEVTEDIEGGLQDLAAGKFDMLTMYALRWRMLGNEKYDPYRDQWAFSPSASARRAIVDHVSGGGGLFGLHTAAICFDDWREWGEILGATWVWGQSGHPPYGQAQVRIDRRDDALVAGLEDFTLNDEVYGHMKIEPDVTPILSARAEGDDPQWHPVIWRRNWRGGRVAFDGLGHDAGALEHPVHKEIIARAARWVAQL